MNNFPFIIVLLYAHTITLSFSVRIANEIHSLFFSLAPDAHQMFQRCASVCTKITNETSMLHTHVEIVRDYRHQVKPFATLKSRCVCRRTANDIVKLSSERNALRRGICDGSKSGAKLRRMIHTLSKCLHCAGKEKTLYALSFRSSDALYRIRHWEIHQSHHIWHKQWQALQFASTGNGQS